MRHRSVRLLAIIFLATQACSNGLAADIHAMTSGAFTAPFKELIVEFEKATGHRVIPAYGASLGGAPDSIPSRLDRAEPADLVIIAGPALDNLIKAGKVVDGSRRDVVISRIGMSVREGAPKPDISTLAAFRKTLLDAKSIGYSASASGTYISTEMLQRMGIADQVLPKATRVVSLRVGEVLARGEFELGFQQISELLPEKGIEFVGPIPEEVQQNTPFSAGLTVNAKQPVEAKQLVDFFLSAGAIPYIRKFGLDPVGGK